MAAAVYSTQRPRKLYPRTKHEVDRMICCGDMAIGHFRNEMSVVDIYLLTLISRYRNVACAE